MFPSFFPERDLLDCARARAFSLASSRNAGRIPIGVSTPRRSRAAGLGVLRLIHTAVATRARMLVSFAATIEAAERRVASNTGISACSRIDDAGDVPSRSSISRREDSSRGTPTCRRDVVFAVARL